MDAEELLRALEAVLFASSEPVPLAKLEGVFAPDGADAAAIRQALEALQSSYTERGIEVRELGGGYQLRTRPEMARWVARLEVQRPVRFSRAALETLAIVAYRQPVTRAEVEEVRGVDCGGVLKTLLERGLARIVGRKDVPGRPLLYSTTRKFLETFGLGSISDLPTLRDIGDLLAEQGEDAVEEEDTVKSASGAPESGAGARAPAPQDRRPADVLADEE